MRGMVVTACARRRWTVRAFSANTYDAYGTGIPPRERPGDRHHAIADPDEVITDQAWVKTGIKIFRPKEWKPKSIGNVTFLLFRLDGEDSLDCLSVVYFIFRIGPGVGVGVGAGVGVDQEPGVGVGTAPPRLRTPALRLLRLSSEQKLSILAAMASSYRSVKVWPLTWPWPEGWVRS